MALGCLSRWCGWFIFLVLRKNIENKKVRSFWKNKNYTTLEGTEGSPGRICLDIIPHAMRGVIVAWCLCGRVEIYRDKKQMKYHFIFSEWPNFFHFQYFFAKPKIKIISIIEINTPVVSKLRSNRPQTRNLIFHHFLLEKSSAKLFSFDRHTYRRAWVAPRSPSSRTGVWRWIRVLTFCCDLPPV